VSASRGRIILPVLLSVACLAPGGVWAASATASVDQNVVAADEVFTLSITVSGASDAVAPDLSRLRGFDVISTGESRSISMVNGATSIQTVYDYVLRPQSQGSKTIPSIQVRAGGQVLRTNPVSVQVMAPRGGASSAPPTLPMPSIPPSGTQQGRGDDVFVRCTVDKKQAYVGEQILLTFSLYYATQLGSADYDPPGTEGFRTQPLPAPPARYEVVNGRQYVLKQDLKLLFPTAPGTRTITPAKVQYTAGFWDPTPRTLTTDPITIQVARLPEAGKPASFSGVVGHLDVDAHVDHDTIRMGEAATLTVAVSGWGNLDAMEAPKLALPAGLRQYQSSEHREVQPQPLGDGFRMGGEALFDDVIIPTTVGDLTVPPVEVGYFDPETGRYDIARSRPVALHVKPGDGEALPGAPVPGQAAQLRPLPDRLIGSRPGRLLSAPVIVSQVAALAWLIGAGLVYWRRSVLASNPKLARARMAARRAARSIRAAGGGAPREAASLIASAVAGYLADRLDIPAATVSAGSVAGLLAERGIAGERAAAVAALLDACDAIRFGPGAEAEVKSLAEGALSAIRGLERALPQGRPAKVGGEAP
jgi:hypothetical protein